MFERILIPLDGSPRAERILDQIGRILPKEYSEVILLQVVDLPLMIKGAEPAIQSDTDGLRLLQREEARKYLDGVGRRLSGSVAGTSIEVAEGSPAETILRKARSLKATMIAMTTHGRTGMARWALGSVAEKVARGSDVPLLLLRSFGPESAAVSPQTLTFRRILVPLDGSPAAVSAVAAAKELAQLFGAEVLLLHAEFPYILPGPELGSYPTPIPSPAEKDPVTEKASDELIGAGIRVQRLTEVGDPASVILDQSQAAHADLIVMATHGRSGIARWVLGSVAERVLRGARIPLLLVRSGKMKGRAVARKRAAKASNA